MGLDISAYSNIEEVTDIEKYDEDALYDFYYTGDNGGFIIQLGKLKQILIIDNHKNPQDIHYVQVLIVVIILGVINWQ